MDKPKSFIDQIKQVDANERKAEEDKNQAEKQKIQHQEKLVQDAYNKRLHLEQVELMRLKQGVISEPELVVQEEKIKRIYTPKEKISNYFYHNKLYIILVSFIVVILFFLVHDIVTTVRPDANILIICSNYELSQKTEEVEALFGEYATDRNGDGKVYASVMYIPIDDATAENAQVYQANTTKLIGEIQSNDSVIIIGNKETIDSMELADYLVDLKERYPDKTNVNELGVLLSDTDFAEKLGVTKIDENMVICVQQINDDAKEKIKINHENALSILDNLMADIG